MNTVTEETLQAARLALSKGTDAKGMQKSVSVGTGLTFYDLQAPAKNLYPVVTPLRNSLPRIQRLNPGDAARWKAVNSILGSGFDAMGWVPEGQRSGTMSYNVSNLTASYVTLGEEDSLTFEAESAAKGFEDENAMVTMRLLQKLMVKEENALIGGNASLALGTPGSITTGASGSGGTLPATTYSVKVAALTLEGMRNSSLTLGVATTKTIVGADGKSFTLNGGSSNISANTTQAVSAGNTLTASVSTVLGAAGYAWFVGAAGSETLQAITTINSVAISTALATGRQAATAVTQDNSANPNLAFDGLLTQALKNGNVTSLATGTAGTGTTLTASGRGSVVEIDTLLQSMWDTYRISPTVMYVNSQELRNLSNKILSNVSGPLLRYDTDGNTPYRLTGGGIIENYFNPFTPDGGVKMPVRVHPTLPAGTILLHTEQLPEWYQNNEVPNVAEVLTRRDYYRMDWPERTRQREYGVYAEEVLAVYAPFAMAVLNNIGNG